MDWFLDPQDRKAASELRRQVAGFLRRHATSPAQVDDAELAVEELLGNAVRHTEANRGAGGNKVQATLLVDRPDEESFAPQQRATGALPALHEADEGGGFGKESFLRALIVQLSQTLEEAHGPHAAQAAVAQVGTDVGGQMEAAYRAAHRVVGRLTAAQMADCYVRLKRAIHGDFYVIEASDERIVLGNRACPFGDVVQRSPSLCRMTSSVFGGIAARNADGATVILEERIAVGDPECRVVVELGGSGAERTAGHRYPAPLSPPAERHT